MSSFAIPIGRDIDLFQVPDGVSKAAEQICLAIFKAKEHEEEAVSLGWRTALKEEIDSLAEEYSVANTEADYVDKSSAYFAKHLVQMLPENIIAPELGPEDRGVSIDWIKGEDQILSISIEGNRVLYAAIIGGKKPHGEMELRNEIPSEILVLLSEYFLKG